MTVKTMTGFAILAVVVAAGTVIVGPWPGSGVVEEIGKKVGEVAGAVDEGGWPTTDSPVLPSGSMGDESDAFTKLLTTIGGLALILLAFIGIRSGSNRGLVTANIGHQGVQRFQSLDI